MQWGGVGRRNRPLLARRPAGKPDLPRGTVEENRKITLPGSDCAGWLATSSVPRGAWRSVRGGLRPVAPCPVANLAVTSRNGLAQWLGPLLENLDLGVK